MISDFTSFKCISDAVELHSKYSRDHTWYYFYTHQGRTTTSKFFGMPDTIDLGKFLFDSEPIFFLIPNDTNRRQHIFIQGVAHMDELYLMFNSGLVADPLNSTDDHTVSEILIDLWTSFAINGYYLC